MCMLYNQKVCVIHNTKTHPVIIITLRLEDLSISQTFPHYCFIRVNSVIFPHHTFKLYGTACNGVMYSIKIKYFIVATLTFLYPTFGSKWHNILFIITKESLFQY